MKIYVLLRQNYEGSDTVCVSENINEIRTNICEICKDFYPEFEIWENGEIIYQTSGSDVLQAISKEMSWNQDRNKKNPNHKKNKENIIMQKAPMLKELLNNRKTTHADTIVICTTKNKNLFKGAVSELPKELLNIQIFAWDKKDGIYITIN